MSSESESEGENPDSAVSLTAEVTTTETPSKRPPPLRGPVSLQQIQQFFHLTAREAAQELKIGVTKLKTLCRSYGISRWPYRQLRSALGHASPMGKTGAVGSGLGAAATGAIGNGSQSIVYFSPFSAAPQQPQSQQQQTAPFSGTLPYVQPPPPGAAPSLLSSLAGIAEPMSSLQPAARVVPLPPTGLDLKRISSMHSESSRGLPSPHDGLNVLARASAAQQSTSVSDQLPTADAEPVERLARISDAVPEGSGLAAEVSAKRLSSADASASKRSKLVDVPSKE